MNNTKHNSFKGHYAECHSAKCHYDECRGALNISLFTKDLHSLDHLTWL
jgi:hypothetical protein